MKTFRILEMVKDTTGSPHHYRRLFRELQHLTHGVNASIKDDWTYFRYTSLMKPVKIIVDLQAELSRGRNDKGQSIGHLLAFVMGQYIIDDGQNKGKSFSAASLREAEQILVFKGVFESLNLNFGRFRISDSLEAINYISMQRKIWEIQAFLRIINLWMLRFIRINLNLLFGVDLLSKKLFFLEVEAHLRYY